MTKEINFAVIQSGYAVFGVGETRDEAVADSVEWMEDVDSIDDVEELLVNPHNAVDGDFYVIDSEHEEFDYYMGNQGGFEKKDGKWYPE